ncbi:hypothetical protein WBG78_11270 [Chryseolinea sp. T2]|uniref:hypothetical protein n=1 Tax=Chryseolinea sp. T2 TaxID=3129255 RepID=UPI0030775BBD
MLSLSDVILLVKKILIGIIVAVIPFLIILGGLWITQRVLGSGEVQTQITTKPVKP